MNMAGNSLAIIALLVCWLRASALGRHRTVGLVLDEDVEMLEPIMEVLHTNFIAFLDLNTEQSISKGFIIHDICVYTCISTDPLACYLATVIIRIASSTQKLAR